MYRPLLASRVRYKVQGIFFLSFLHGLTGTGGTRQLKAWRFVGQGDWMQEERDQIWLKPNADVGDISSIWGYALTVDGYRYAKINLGVECGDLANQKLEIFERSGIWQGSFEELR